MGRLRIESLDKAYGAVEVLHGISIDIVDGQFVALVGPSGCGKSTLLQLIAGLEEITSGAIYIDEVEINQKPPKDRGVAMVFQNYALYPHMTVARNIGFPLRMSGETAGVIASKTSEVADLLGLTSYLDRYPRQLSGGQRQRVAMGRAIIRNAEVFLFDEPLSNLDAKLRVQMRAEIKKLHQRLGTTTVYVTHDQVEAMTMADRIVVLQDGRVEQIGTPSELFNDPTNMFVAGFIGSPSMNLVRGTLNAAPEGVSFRAGESFRLPLDRFDDDVGDGLDVVLGIRPHNIVLGEGPLSAMVSLVEPTGPETHVHLEIGDAQLLAAAPETTTCQPGDLVPVDLSRNAIRLFSAASGDRIREPKMG